MLLLDLIAYYYIVSVNNTAGEYANSTQFSLPPFTITSAPQALIAKSGNRFVFLSWSTPLINGGSAITGYNIYVSTDGGTNFTLLTTIGSLTRFYNDTGLTGGQSYYYLVSATNYAGKSANSTEVSSTPYSIPFTPQTLQIQTDNTFIILSWSTPS